VGDCSGVVQCFSVKRGEVALAFKTMPGLHKVEWWCAHGTFSCGVCAACAHESMHARLVPRGSRSEGRACSAASHESTTRACTLSTPSLPATILANPPLLLQVTSVSLGRHPLQRDKIFVASGGVVRLPFGVGAYGAASALEGRTRSFGRCHLI
jgi:hypothetical protein